MGTVIHSVLVTTLSCAVCKPSLPPYLSMLMSRVPQTVLGELPAHPSTPPPPPGSVTGQGKKQKVKRFQQRLPLLYPVYKNAHLGRGSWTLTQEEKAQVGNPT